MTGPVDLTGTFTGYNGGEQECVSGTCTFTGIVKRVGLVTFTADDPSLGSVEVTKP